MSAAVVLFSGGQDSTTALFWAIQRFDRVIALSFDYGQRHLVELDRAEEIIDLARDHITRHRPGTKLEHQISDIGPDALPWVKSALLGRSREPADFSPDHDGLPKSFVPARNAIFLSFAAGLAYTERAPIIVIGANAVDYSGYPDCRPHALRSFGEGLSHMVAWSALSISMPLAELSKKQIVELAHDLGPYCWAAIGRSWSCYAPDYHGTEFNVLKASRGEPSTHARFRACGKCPACTLRAQGFEEAGIPDPATQTLFRVEPPL